MAGTTQALASGTRPVTVASSTASSTPDPTDEHVADVMRVRATAMAEARESAVELLALAAVAVATTGIAEVVGDRPSWWPPHVPTSTRPRPLV